MKRELIPYYASRAALSALLGWVVASGGEWWLGLLMGALTFAAFVWYAHSGRYLIDPSRPLAPLRRDARGEAIRDRAAVMAVVAGGLVYGVLALAAQVVPLTVSAGTWGLLAGVVTYFAASNWHFIRGQK